MGLLNEVVDDGQALTAARATGALIARQGRLALRLAKLALNASSRTGQDTGLLLEQISQAVLFESQDKLDRMTAFLERRKS
jgi:enoyl-CoA hydratase